jgi:hypothetical protein
MGLIDPILARSRSSWANSTTSKASEMMPNPMFVKDAERN